MKAGIRLAICVACVAGGAASAEDGTPVQPVRQMPWSGPYFLLGAGLEGYTGALAPDVNPGPSYGVILGLRPSEHLGVEFAYSGGVSELSVAGGAISGPDIVRNGAQAAVTLGLNTKRLQPYAFTGIGVERYAVRQSFVDFRFISDTGGYVPAGLGLRYQLTPTLTADARASYNSMFGQDFDTAVANGHVLDGRYQALVQLGGSY